MSSLPVLSPHIIRENPDDYYVIIATHWSKSKNVKNQMMSYGVSGRDFAFYFPITTMDFEMYENQEYVNAAIEAFSDAYKYIPLWEISYFWLASSYGSWVMSMELSKDICNWILCDYGTKKHLNMLDVGPGIGIQSISLNKLLDVKVTWIDVLVARGMPKAYANIDSMNLKYLQEHLDIRLQQGNIETIHCDFTEKFDFILFSNVLEHFHYHPVQTIKKMLSWLKQNGKIYLAVPDAKFTKGPRNFESWRDMPIYDAEHPLDIYDYDHIQEYYYDEAIDLFNELSLRVERFTRSNNGGIMEFTLSPL